MLLIIPVSEIIGCVDRQVLSNVSNNRNAAFFRGNPEITGPKIEGTMIRLNADNP
jgi:hypothetical protein